MITLEIVCSADPVRDKNSAASLVAQAHEKTEVAVDLRARSEEASVLPALQRGLGGLVLLKIIQVLQEQQPGSLLGVIKLGRAARFFPKDVIDVFEGLFEH